MEKTTIYIHKTKNDKPQKHTDNDYRVVSFISGDKDIVQILKKLIKDKINS